jgi:hypothetical protein
VVTREGALVSLPLAEDDAEEEAEDPAGETEPKFRLKPLAFRPLSFEGGGGVGAQEGGGVRAEVDERRRFGAEGERWRFRLTEREELSVRGAGRLRAGAVDLELLYEMKEDVDVEGLSKVGGRLELRVRGLGRIRTGGERESWTLGEEKVACEGVSRFIAVINEGEKKRAMSRTMDIEQTTKALLSSETSCARIC